MHGSSLSSQSRGQGEFSLEAREIKTPIFLPLYEKRYRFVFCVVFFRCCCSFSISFRFSEYTASFFFISKNIRADRIQISISGKANTYFVSSLFVSFVCFVTFFYVHEYSNQQNLDFSKKRIKQFPLKYQSRHHLFILRGH